MSLVAAVVVVVFAVVVFVFMTNNVRQFSFFFVSLFIFFSFWLCFYALRRRTAKALKQKRLKKALNSHSASEGGVASSA